MSTSRQAFEQVFQDCYDPVLRYAARRVRPEAVQDVVSETFLAAWRRYDELKGEPLPWLLGIARRTAANQRRGSARRDALHQRLSGEHASAGEDRPALDDMRLQGALATLAARDCEALMLVAWDGLEHRVAASVMGCSTGAFTVRIHRARRKLRQALGEAELHPIDVTQKARSLP